MGIEIAASQGGAAAGGDTGYVARIDALKRIVVRDPTGAAAEQALTRIAEILSRELRAVAPVLAAGDERPGTAGTPVSFETALGRSALGSADWIALVPPVLRDELLADIVTVQGALLADPGSAAGLAPAGPALVADALTLCRAEGFRPCLFHVLRHAPADQRSAILGEVASGLAETDPAASTKAWWFAYAADPGPARARLIAQKMFKGGNVTSAGPLMRSAWTGHGTLFMGELLLAERLFLAAPAIPPPASGSGRQRGEVAYVASSTQSFRQIGYTVRTHQMLAALQAAGTPVRCYARPGYPWDRPAAGEGETDAPEAETVDGIRYAYSRIPDVSRQPESFIERMADGLEQRFRASPPRLVHAASNHRNALPALIAARRIGVPFIYEVRGLWELTAATRNAAWELTERFALERRLELTVAAAADHVLTITDGVAAELVDGGVARERVSLLPNAVDPQRFLPRPKHPRLVAAHGLDRYAVVLAYCGSLTGYEGLDDLIAAVGILAGRGVAAKLLIVGDGPSRGELRSQAASQGLGAAIAFLDPVDAAEVAEYWALADVVALPRKPFRVCEIVSPLKPFEAMAMGKPVVLSDLAASREIVRHGETGFLCRPADPGDLADTLERLAREPEMAAGIGEAGRAWVTSDRSWTRNVARLQSLYDRLAGDPAAANEARRAAPARAEMARSG